MEQIGLQIQLGEKDGLIYSSLLWHYRMGIRHFEILHQGLTPSQNKKIQMFYNRVTDHCSLNVIALPGESDFASTHAQLGSLKWFLQLTDRQFLCLHKPLGEILSEHESSTLNFPSCVYSGFDSYAPVSFWPQTDERLIYRSPIDDEHTVSLLNQTSSGDAVISNAAHIATFAKIEAATPFISEMVRDQLPFMEVIRHSIYSANLREKGYWDDGDYVESIAHTQEEVSVKAFMTQYGEPNNTRYGDKYIYMVNEKCGCNTITRALGSYEADRIIDIPEPRGFHKSTFETAERCQYLSSREFYKFTCVRNPFNRALSAYLDKIASVKEIFARDEEGRVFTSKETWPREGLGFNLTEKISFEQFLKRLKTKTIKEMDNHFKPMWAVTMHPVITYDKIVHLENFNEEFQEVMNSIGIPGKASDYFSAEHATKAGNKLSDYYTPQCVRLVQEIYGGDFYHFEYSKTPQFSLKRSMDVICLL